MIDRVARLTPRERQVIMLSWLGIHDAGIAAILGISSHTVRNYWAAAFDRLGIRADCGSLRPRAAALLWEYERRRNERDAAMAREAA
jgi:DNA-binding NarL/FixJ family response regulator